MGTHAHELMMVTAQLLAARDDEAGGPGGPVAMSALLSHLLFLRANGGLGSATALPDTFGTVAFVEVRPYACFSIDEVTQWRHPPCAPFDRTPSFWARCQPSLANLQQELRAVHTIGGAQCTTKLPCSNTKRGNIRV